VTPWISNYRVNLRCTRMLRTIDTYWTHPPEDDYWRSKHVAIVGPVGNEGYSYADGVFFVFLYLFLHLMRQIRV